MSVQTASPTARRTSLVTGWLLTGMFALPAYGLLTFASSLNPQPDPDVDYAAWARFVTTDGYLWGHLLGSTVGLVLAVFGVVALGAYLSRGRSPRLAVGAMIITLLGHLLFLNIMALSTFAAPETARAYLAGVENIRELQSDPTADAAVGLMFVAVIAFSLIGNVALGVAVWRSGLLPRTSGALWVISAVLLYALGLIIGALITHDSPPTEPFGALVVLAAGGWMALAAVRAVRR